MTIIFFPLEGGAAETKNSALSCEIAMKNLEERFYKVLLSEQASSVRDAFEFLKQSKSCEKTTEDHALIDDLFGEAAHIAFKYSGDKIYFDGALDAYKKALGFNTPRNEKIYWHISRLMRSAGRYPEAVQYINKVLDMRPKPKEPLPYLETAFQLTVDTKQWDDAKGLMGELSRRDQRFYADPNLLLTSVEVLCHVNQFEDAKKIIKNVEEHVKLDEAGNKILQAAKKAVKECEKK